MKNKTLLLLALLLSTGFLMAQTAAQVYNTSTNYRTQTQDGNVIDDQKIETITYYNGLGQTVQTIGLRAGGQKQNIVQHNTYNEYGKQTKMYLPWASSGQLPSGSSADFIAPNVLEADINAFYNTSKYEFTTNPYSETRHEETPLMRPLEAGAPGNDWVIGSNTNTNHTVRSAYSTNVTSDQVFHFEVSTTSPTLANDAYEPTLSLSSTTHYGLSTLSKNITKDENWKTADGSNNTTETFTNKLGQMILKRNYNSGNGHDTYYIYDDFGNLTYVLSPEASDDMVLSGSLASNYQTTLDKLGYQYKYDYKNRPIEKKVPGKGWEYVIYDNLDRPLLTQDANMNSKDQWHFVKFDALGREVYTGFYTTTVTRSILRSTLASQTVLHESRQSAAQLIGDTSLYYSNTSYPTNASNMEVLTVSYYDDYVDMGGLGVPPATVYGVSTLTNPKSLPTVSKVRVLLDNQSIWITTLTGYDVDRRVVYSASHNDYINTVDTIKNELDFSGQVQETTSTHQKTGADLITTIDYFIYDHMGRMKSHKQEIDDSPIQLIAENNYDDLGQLEQKLVGGETFQDGYTDITNATITTEGTIVKDPLVSNGYNAGAKTNGEFEGDGGIRFTIPGLLKNFRVGLVKTSSLGIPGWDDFDFALEYRIGFGTGSNTNPRFEVIFDGQTVSNVSLINFLTGDILSVERIGSTIYYKHGNTTVYSQVDNTATAGAFLSGKVGLNHTEANVEELTLFSYDMDTELQRVDYKYNVRGWLTDINDIEGEFRFNTDLFTFRINYNQVQSNTSATSLYNGNISQTFWRTQNDDQNIRGYSYGYDDLNRIEDGLSLKGDDTMNNVVVNNIHNLGSVSFDKNGNINTLTRSGKNFTNSTNGQWDDLQYTYDGNQLIKVFDNSTSALKDYGFHTTTPNTNTDHYTYDVNGNMTADTNKDMIIEYNFMNLPTEAVFNNDPTKKITYIYDAVGIKLRKIETDGVSVYNTDYAGNFIYINNTLEFFNHPEGYIDPVANTLKSVKGYDGDSGQITYSDYQYVFQYKDHLGNIRLSYSDADLNGAIDPNTEIVEEINYYPFGLEQYGYNRTVDGGDDWARNWRFGGKEFNNEHSLGWYDVSARNYDPAIGRWMNIDPLVEAMRRHSPYNYAFDNPIFFVDPDGMMPIALAQGNFDAMGFAIDSSQTFTAGMGGGISDTVIVTGNEATSATTQLDASVDGMLDISRDSSSGELSYARTGSGPLTEAAQTLVNAIDDTSIIVNVDATNASTTPSGVTHDTGGIYSGNTISSVTDPVSGKPIVSTLQDVNAPMLDAVGTYYGTPGMDMLHETNESYEGGLQAQSSGMSSGNSNAPGNSYSLIHARTLAHSPQNNYFVRFNNTASGARVSSRAIGVTETTFVQSPGRPPLTISTLRH